MNSNFGLVVSLLACVLMGLVGGDAHAGQPSSAQMDVLKGLAGQSGLGALVGKSGGGRSGPGYDAVAADQLASQPLRLPVDRTPSAIEISIQARVNSLLGVSIESGQKEKMDGSVLVQQGQGARTIQELKLVEQRRQGLLIEQQKRDDFNQQAGVSSQNSQDSALNGLSGQRNKTLPWAQGLSQEDKRKQLKEEEVQIRAYGSEMQQYGYTLFSGVPTTFLPANDVPIPPEYVLGPGDELSLQFYGSRDDSLSLVVDREGVIELPQVGQMALAGMSFVEAKALIAEGVRQKMIGATVSVAMGRLRSIRVFVLGDVNYPGSYVVSGLSTVSHALYAAGGVSKKGSLRHVQLKRSGKVVRELDLYDFLLRGNNHGDSRLQPGDVVFVPPIGPVVGVAGQVVRPGIYEIDQERNVAEVMALAGGALPDADVGHMQIERISTAGNRKLIDADLKDVAQKRSAKNGDILLLHSVPGVRTEEVLVAGEVSRPGRYGFHVGMKVSDLISAAGSVTERAYTKVAEVTRYKIENGDTRETEHFTVDLEAALKGDPEADVLLKAYDELQVKSISQWEPSGHITLTGEVKFPGVYAIEDGERLASVIKRAGGFSENAYLPAAVFTREAIRLEQVKRTDEMIRRVEADIAKGRTQLQSIHDGKLMIDKENALNGAEQMLEQLKNLEPQGRLIVELSPLDVLERGPFNIKLKDGDVLHLPSKPDQVLVMGEVYNQTAMIFQTQLERDDYIQRAGGFTASADEDRVYVVRASGYVDSGLGWGKSNKIYPGDVIVVPQSLEQFNLLDSMLDWSKVIMQLSTGAATLRVLGVI